LRPFFKPYVIEALLLSFIYQFVVVRLVRFDFRLPSLDLIALVSITRAAGSGTVFPYALTAFAHRYNMIQSSFFAFYFDTAILTFAVIS
jgi:hypothetical protein